VPFRARILDQSFSNKRAQSSRLRAFGILAAVQVTLIAAITAVVVSLPQLRADLDLTEGQTILVSSGYGLSFSGLLLLGARVGERVGWRRCLLAGLAVFTVAAAAGGQAGDWPALIAARLAQGAGAALAAPAAMGLLSVVFPDTRARARALASWGVLASVGAVTGTLAGGAVAGVLSWRWCLWAVALAGAAEIAAVWRLVPAGPPGSPGRLDAAGAVTVTGAVCLLSYGLVETTDRRWESAPAAIPILAGVVLLAGFLVAERRAENPLVPLGLLARRGRAVALATIWVTAAATATVTLFCSLYFQQVQGLSPLAATVRLVPLGAVFAAAAVAVRPAVSRLGPRVAAIAGLAAAGGGLVLLGRLGVSAGYLGPVLAGLLVFPAAASLAFAAGTVLALEDTAQADAGAAVGLLNLAMETGPTVGLALLVSLAGTVSGPDAGPAALAHGYGIALRAAACVLFAAAVAMTVATTPSSRS
jgi:MFS family permease